MTRDLAANQPTAKPLTGKHVLAIFIGVFGVIIAVNLTMAYSAVQTFPGLVVRNSYVASQGFNDRLAEQLALGWESALSYEEGELRLRLTNEDGSPAELASLTAEMGRATHIREDFTPVFTEGPEGFTAPADLAPGYWHLRIVGLSPEGSEFRQTLRLFVSARG